MAEHIITIIFKQLLFCFGYAKIKKISNDNKGACASVSPARHQGLNNTKKIVVKTAVKTVLIIIAVLVVAFAVASLGFPQHMATFYESIGNYPAAVMSASLRYSYTGDCYDLARCVDDSILSEKSELVLEYGEKLLAHDDFEEVCAAKTQSIKEYNKNNRPEGSENVDFVFDYKQYVCGKIAVAKYVRGDFEGALATATQANGTSSFAQGNALMTLAMSYIADEGRVSSFADVLLAALEDVNPSAEDEAALLREVYNSVKSLKI